MPARNQKRREDILLQADGQVNRKQSLDERDMPRLRQSDSRYGGVQTMIYEVTKISFTTIALLFVGYIVSHSLIYVAFRNYDKRKDTLDTDEQQVHKYLKIISKWYAVPYVIFVIIYLLM